MQIKNTIDQYGSMSKIFHWTIAILVIIMLCVGLWMTGIEDKALRGNIYFIHKLTGLAILILMTLRMIWALNNPKPPMPKETPIWERYAVFLSHLLLYILLFLMPISGWIMSTAAGHPPKLFQFKLPLIGIPQNEMLAKLAGLTHEILAWTLITILILHISGALKHHFINKDNILRRMLCKK